MRAAASNIKGGRQIIKYRSTKTGLRTREKVKRQAIGRTNQEPRNSHFQPSWRERWYVRAPHHAARPSRTRYRVARYGPPNPVRVLKAIYVLRTVGLCTQLNWPQFRVLMNIRSGDVSAANTRPAVTYRFHGRERRFGNKRVEQKWAPITRRLKK
jgi:hypothetical protein